jgi:hypothetical protein
MDRRKGGQGPMAGGTVIVARSVSIRQFRTRVLSPFQAMATVVERSLFRFGSRERNKFRSTFAELSPMGHFRFANLRGVDYH